MTTSIGKDGPINPPPDAMPPEPEQFEPFHKRLFKQGMNAIRDYEKGKLSKDLLSKDKLAKSYRAIRCGVLAREFLEGEFWTEFMKPAFEDEQDVKTWTPGDARTFEAVAVDHIFSSGKAALAKWFIGKLEEWIRLGDEAKKIIAAHVETQKKMREIGR